MLLSLARACLASLLASSSSRDATAEETETEPESSAERDAGTAGADSIREFGGVFESSEARPFGGLCQE